MFGIGTTEILLILVVALLVIGPSKLPEVARALGKGMAEFRRMSSDVKRTIDLETQFSDQDDSSSEEDAKTGDRAIDEIPKGQEDQSDHSEAKKDKKTAKNNSRQEQKTTRSTEET